MAEQDINPATPQEPGLDPFPPAASDGPAELSDPGVAVDPLAGQEPMPEIDLPQGAAADGSTGPASSEPRSGKGVIGLQKIQQLKVRVQAVLGTAPLTISELANLERGDLISLDTKIGDAISILANGDEIARAEIIVTQDDPPRFGLTLTEIVEANSAPK